jgi:hypothetical protein
MRWDESHICVLDTLIEHPAALTHRLVPDTAREASGVPANLLRLSVGLEDVEDIWDDLDRALSGHTEPDQTHSGHDQTLSGHDQALSGHCEQGYIKSSSSDFREPVANH